MMYDLSMPGLGASMGYYPSDPGAQYDLGNWAAQLQQPELAPTNMNGGMSPMGKMSLAGGIGGAMGNLMGGGKAQGIEQMMQMMQGPLNQQIADVQKQSQQLDPSMVQRTTRRASEEPPQNPGMYGGFYPAF